MHTLAVILLTAATTALIFLVAINFVTAEKRMQRRPKRLYTLRDGDFRRAMGVLLGPAILPGNQITTLINGNAIFPAMLAALRGAQHTVCFETFIYWSGGIGQAFADALVVAVGRGVRVHVLLDWIGTRRMDPRLLNQLRDNGVEVQIYHPLSWYHVGRLNNRTHRKLLVVDGSVGFTGGVGIAPQWTGNAQDAGHWRDTHFRIAGPVVAQMQAVFLDNWIKSTGSVLHGDDYFPKLQSVGEMDAQMFGSSPTGGSESMHLMFLLAITAAKRSIDITSSYFVPDDMTLQALVSAARRGVRVRILVPGRITDAPSLRRASQAKWGGLLRAGVEIHEYQPTMMHAKIVTVDQYWTSVGSANFDNRSFRLNDEANLNVFSDALAQEQLLQFEKDLSLARPVSLRSWRRRPLRRRLHEFFVLLIRSQL
ncbi:MAG: phospholipase D-like domain-containing protein [Steroidobacteraceae bacterium]